jgi:hypothetical protein
MTGQGIDFTENDQISGRNLSICRQNFCSTARFQRPQPRTKPRINDPAENHQINQNHQIPRNSASCLTVSQRLSISFHEVASGAGPAFYAIEPRILRCTCKTDRSVIGTSLVILRISGRITGRDLDMIRAALAASELNGTELRNCPAYIREWVTREGANKHASQDTRASQDSEDA